MARVNFHGVWTACAKPFRAAQVFALTGFAFHVLGPGFVFPASGGNGGMPGQFLNYGAGARALGMGGAFYALADDASASYWNPAGLAQMERKEFSFMHTSLFADTSLMFSSYAHPTATRGTFAVNYTQLASKGYEKVSVTFNPATEEIIDIQTLGTFDSAESAIGGAWGRYITKTLSVGFQAKYISRRMDTSSDSSLAMDISMLNKFGRYRLALGIQNAVSRTSGDTDDSMPMNFKMGNGFLLFRDRLYLGFDINKPQQGTLSWRFGSEYWLMKAFGVRIGIVGSPGLQETDFGCSLKYQYFGVDIAQGIHALGSTTRISVSLRFGQTTEERHGIEVRKLLEGAMTAFRRGNFFRATSYLNRAHDADPGNMRVKKMLPRLETAIGFIPESTGVSEVENYIRRGVITYVDGQDLRAAVNALRYAFNKKPKDDRLLALLNIAERELGLSELTRKPEGPELFTFVDQKVYDARQAIYEGRYDVALRRAQDVLDLEPKNETALEIMGSAFFLMDQKGKAKLVWERVLEINPDNKVVKEFLRQME